MKTKKKFNSENNLISKFSMILPMFLFATVLIAQTPTNFSGKWAFNKTKSNLGEGASFLDGDEILVINQDAALMITEHTLIRKGSDNFVSTDTCRLDGKETIEKSDMGTTKKTAKWSTDKKILTISTIMTFDPDVSTAEYRVDESYKLSDDRKTLTIESFSKNPTGERKTILIYNKK